MENQMTNNKDSAVLDEDFEIVVGRKHHETKVSQAKLLQLINGGAKIHHIKALRQPTQSDALREALAHIAFSGADGPYGVFGEALNEYQMRRVALAALQDQSNV